MFNQSSISEANNLPVKLIIASTHNGREKSVLEQVIISYYLGVLMACQQIVNIVSLGEKYKQATALFVISTHQFLHVSDDVIRLVKYTCIVDASV